MDYIKINIKKNKTANTVSSSTGMYINGLVEQNLVAIEIIEIDKFKKTKYHEYNKKIFLQIFNLVIAQKYWYASKNRQKSQKKIPKTVKTNRL